MKGSIARILFFVLAIILTVVLTVYLTDTSGTPDSYTTYSIYSGILDEDREILVRTPQGYENDLEQTYPMIYIFGGNTLTFSLAEDLQLLHRTGHLEPVIVVGIPNINQDSRQRDLTPPFMKQDLDEADSPMGMANNYLQYVEEELLPMLEERYRSSGKNIAVGHSREGLMVLYSMLRNAALFDGILSLSPALWREEGVFLDSLQTHLDNSDTIGSAIFLSMGDLEVDKMKAAFDRADSIFMAHDDKMTYRSVYTPGALHSNNALLSAPIGIDWILKE